MQEKRLPGGWLGGHMDDHSGKDPQKRSWEGHFTVAIFCLISPNRTPAELKARDPEQEVGWEGTHESQQQNPCYAAASVLKYSPALEVTFNGALAKLNFLLPSQLQLLGHIWIFLHC